MAHCPPQSWFATGAKHQVASMLGDLRSDMSIWAGAAESAAADLTDALGSVIFSPEDEDFSVDLPPFSADFSAGQPESTEISDWSLGSAPSYSGPLSINVPSMPAAPAAPSISLTLPSLTLSEPAGISPMANPAALVYTPISYTDPGGKPTGDVDTVANYNGPAPFEPDLSVLGLGSINPPDKPTVSVSQPVFPVAPVLQEPTFSGPVEVNVHQPAAISWSDIGSRPSWTGTAPTFDFSGEPSAFAGAPMPTAPTLSTVTLPVYTGPADPTAPILEDITIPEIRDVELPAFDVSITQESIPTLTTGFSYTDPGYTDAQVDQIKGEVSRVLNGDVGIPAHLWDAIWDKTAHQITRAGVAREREGRNAWAALGWSMPGGVALAQQEQAAFDINQQLSEKAREQAIQRATMEREDFWNAVQHGVAFQKILIDLYNAFQERQLRAQVALVEAMVSVYNANVARYNANLNRAQAEIAVKELELKGALSQLEVDKGKMEGARVEAQVQQQIVQTYVAKWEGVKAAVQKFQGMVEAKKAELDVQRLRVQTYGEEVKARSIEVDAWAKEWDGYVAKVEGQKAKAQVYEVESKVFAEQMRGFGVASEAEKAKIQAMVSSEQLQLEKSKTEIENFRAKWAGLETTLNSKLKMLDTRVQQYSAETQAKGAEGQFLVEAEKLKTSLYNSDINAYNATVQGVAQKAQAIAQLYNAEAARYRADTDGSIAEVDASAKRVQAQAQRIDAQARAYSAAIEGERTKTDAQAKAAEVEIQRYQTDAEVNKAKTQTDVARYEGELKYEELRVEKNRLDIDGKKAELDSTVAAFQAQVEGFAALVRGRLGDVEAQAKAIDAARGASDAQATAYRAAASAEAARIGAEGQKASADAATAGAKASWASAAAQVASYNYQANAKAADLRLRSQIENAKINVQKVLGITEIQTKGLEGAASVYAQLAAGAYSAANVSASIQDSWSAQESQHFSCNDNYNTSFEGTA